MDGNRPSASTWRAVALVTLVVSLATAVAVASSGSIPSGTGGARRPAAFLADTAVSLLLVALVIGGVFAVIILAFFRHDGEIGARAQRRRRGPLGAIGSALVGLALVLIAVRVVRSDQDGNPVIQLPGLAGGPGLADEQRERYEPQLVLWPTLLVCALVTAAAIAIVLNRRAGRPRSVPVQSPELALADVLDETLDDLRAETDPRRAVIATYTRMERALGAAGLPRLPTEAPEEYLGRILDAVVVTPLLARRLTDLFALARFSVHDVDLEMKEQAIDTLVRVRDDLRAAAARDELAAAAAPLVGRRN